MKQAEVERFWRFCADRGVTSKKLVLRPHTSCVSPLTLIAGEPIRLGSPIISVPYSAVVNAQTAQGGRMMHSLPPYAKMMRFLTRRSRMSRMSAEMAWLAAYLAVYKKTINTPCTNTAVPLAPLFASSVQPDLPYLFTAANAAECPALGNQPQSVLDLWAVTVTRELRVTNAMIRFFQERQRRGSSARTTTVEQSDLDVSYRTVMQRALLLPLNCELSAPASLPEFLEDATDCPLLPSFVPVIDAIRAAKEKEQENCVLYTCAKSDFVSPSTRRRVLMETSPLSSRRVVVVATKDIKDGDELLVGVEW